MGLRAEFGGNEDLFFSSGKKTADHRFTAAIPIDVARIEKGGSALHRRRHDLRGGLCRGFGFFEVTVRL